MTRRNSRSLVAGIGNIFLGDDGFGVEVARRLAAPRRCPTASRSSTSASAACTSPTSCSTGYDAARPRRRRPAAASRPARVYAARARPDGLAGRRARRRIRHAAVGASCRRARVDRASRRDRSRRLARELVGGPVGRPVGRRARRRAVSRRPARRGGHRGCARTGARRPSTGLVRRSSTCARRPLAGRRSGSVHDRRGGVLELSCAGRLSGRGAGAACDALAAAGRSARASRRRGSATSEMIVLKPSSCPSRTVRAHVPGIPGEIVELLARPARPGQGRRQRGPADDQHRPARRTSRPCPATGC